DVRGQARSGAEAHPGTDDAIRADHHLRPQLGGGGDDGAWMDGRSPVIRAVRGAVPHVGQQPDWHQALRGVGSLADSTSVYPSSASTTTVPSTDPMAFTFPNAPRCQSISTSVMKVSPGITGLRKRTLSTAAK